MSAYRDYAEEAEKMTKEAKRAATEAEKSLSREAIRSARSKLTEAVAMHQRAANEAPSVTATKGHKAIYEELQDRSKALTRLVPRTK